MSTLHHENGESDTRRIFVNSYFSPANPDNVVITTTDLVNSSPPTNSTTWIDKFYHVQNLFSGSFRDLLFRIIDVTLLIIGLSSSCSKSSSLAITSICLLLFNFLDLLIVSGAFIRNLSSNNSLLTEEQKAEQLRHTMKIRKVFDFFKFIPICAGTAYSFSSSPSGSDDCELTRFFLGIVCLSTWLVYLCPIITPDLPTRRSLLAEGFIAVVAIIINCTYIGTVANSMNSIRDSNCTSSGFDDWYLGAPLKSFAFFGIIFYACTTGMIVINSVVNQVYFRSNRRSQIYSLYYGLQFIMNNISNIIFLYYFSVGGLLLFQPRSGGICGQNAPDLNKTLLIWQWIKMLSPIICLALALVLCCLGACLGILLSYCLPASITVALLEFIQVKYKFYSFKPQHDE